MTGTKNNDDTNNNDDANADSTPRQQLPPAVLTPPRPWHVSSSPGCSLNDQQPSLHSAVAPGG
jgi:hypothetical protein